MSTRERKKGRPRGVKPRKPSEMTKLFVDFGSRECRRKVDRLAAHYSLSKAALIRALIAEATRRLDAGKPVKVPEKAAAE